MSSITEERRVLLGRTAINGGLARGAPRASARRHLTWLGAGIVLSFLVPFVLADQLDLQRDVYYGLYMLFVVGLFAGWAHDTGQSLRELSTRRWKWTLALGLVFATASTFIALRAADATTHPDGFEFIGAIVWRGVLYGAADGLLLSAFPILVVFAALTHSRLRRARGGLVAVGAVAMLVSLMITATYHLGYSDFRSSKLRKPVTGDLVWSVPTLATLNPVGAPVAHAAVHVTAVTHSYDTDLFLPPH
jgi:hypothetical protein